MGRMSPTSARYDDIGQDYGRTRREDPRIAAIVHDCLGPGQRVLNVGAGTGSYEPAERDVVAVEPSAAMLSQRGDRPGAAVRGVAEDLPFSDATFDVAMAVLTVHHWHDLNQGLSELRRVAPRQVVFFFEPLSIHGFWAVEYFPEALELPVETSAPGLDELSAELDVHTVRPVPVPNDCIDGFGLAFWARPEAMLRPEVQAGMSWLALLDDDARARGTQRLRDDLATGAWDARFGHLRTQEHFDGGYRIAIAGTESVHNGAATAEEA